MRGGPISIMRANLDGNMVNDFASNYVEKRDEELTELAARSADLVDEALHALAEEMQRRQLDTTPVRGELARRVSLETMGRGVPQATQSGTGDDNEEYSRKGHLQERVYLFKRFCRRSLVFAASYFGIGALILVALIGEYVSSGDWLFDPAGRPIQDGPVRSFLQALLSVWWFPFNFVDIKSFPATSAIALIIGICIIQCLVFGMILGLLISPRGTK